MNLFQLLQVAQIFQLRNFVVPQVELFQILQTVQVLNLPNIVPLQIQMGQVRKTSQLFDPGNLIVVQIQDQYPFCGVYVCLRKVKPLIVHATLHVGSEIHRNVSHSTNSCAHKKDDVENQ